MSGQKLEQLVSDLKMFFSNSSNHKTVASKIVKRFEVLGNSDVYQMINEVLCDENLLSNIAKLSHIQKNGFYKIVIESNIQFSLRLHIYAKSLEAQENLHSHRWFFVSKVIHGCLYSEEWEDSQDLGTQSFPEYAYTSKSDSLAPIGTANVALVKKSYAEQGSVYAMFPDTLHRIIDMDQDLVATLVVRSNVYRNSARNIIVNNRLPDVSPIIIDGIEIAEVLSNLSKSLKNN